MNKFSMLKEDRNLDLSKIEKFISSLQEEINNNNTSNNATDLLQMLAIEIDLRKLIMAGYNIGNTLMVFAEGNAQNSGRSSGRSSERSFGHFQEEKRVGNFFQKCLARGEKIAILSPGLRSNTADYINKVSLNDYIGKQLASENNLFDVADEVFFQLKKNKNNDFLKYDASLILI
ncbi:MAG: hypothetical protein HQK53_20250, partial [Oligoflexia bacterium]|nr:hypothetical protein [Oligoflexia bacterium]